MPFNRAKTFFVLLAIVIITGCKSMNTYLAVDADEPVTEALSVVLYSEIRNPQCAGRDVFSAGQTPAIRISGYGGEKARYLVFEADTNKFITGQNVLLKTGRAHYRPLPNIQPGKYKVMMAGTGMPSLSCTFTVNNY